jgi:RNA polymerase sigma-70 factor, ECF subfamily
MAIRSHRFGVQSKASGVECDGRASVCADGAAQRGPNPGAAARDAIGPIVEAAANGDRSAMGVLYERFAPMIHAVLLTRVDHADAEDLTHDVFVTAMHRLGDVREPEAVGAWFVRIARSRAVDFHRASARRARLRVVFRRRDLSGVEAGSEGTVSSDGQASKAIAEIRALPEAYRETLMMRLVEGLSGPEIAEKTGMTHGSVRVNLHRGMALLRRRLDTEDVT